MKAVAVYLDLCLHNKAVISESGKYLTADGSRIKCEAHDATFTLHDGECDKDPCSGETLAKIPFEVIEASVRYCPRVLTPQSRSLIATQTTTTPEVALAFND